MGRSSKLNKQTAPEEPITALFETILADVINAMQMPSKDWFALSKTPLVPLAIPIDDGHEYRVTQTGVDAAHKIAGQTWDSRKDLQQTITREAFTKIAFRGIGLALRDCRSHSPAEISPDTELNSAFYAKIAADYQTNLDRLAAAARPDLDRHFPCHLFHTKEAVPAFSVGPVEFLPRADWIVRYVKDQTVRGYIAQVENGALASDSLRKQAFVPQSDRSLHDAWDILSWLQTHTWVATIRMKGHELSQSHQKASIIVGLALDAIGLRFQVEDARRFAKAGRQHLYAEDRMATTKTGQFLKGWSVQMPGIGAAPGVLAAMMQSEQSFLDAAGNVLQAYVDGRQTSSAHPLIERWANALYWVGEARREASDFMAVVKYGCAADGLSGAGGDAKVMTTFAEAALNPKGTPTPPNTLSIDDAVTTVYREGRNKLAHGEMAGLLEDVSKIRTVGDNLLVLLFDVVTFELDTVINTRKEILTLPEKIAYRALEARLKQRP